MKGKKDTTRRQPSPFGTASSAVLSRLARRFASRWK
jgi:hypothetical protein